jgi:hypothetical protein
MTWKGLMIKDAHMGASICNMCDCKIAWIQKHLRLCEYMYKYNVHAKHNNAKITVIQLTAQEG